jgi:hypothetical protein
MVKRANIETLHVAVQESPSEAGSHKQCHTISQWIGLRENLQETMVFTIKYRGFL